MEYCPCSGKIRIIEKIFKTNIRWTKTSLHQSITLTKSHQFKQLRRLLPSTLNISIFFMLAPVNVFVFLSLLNTSFFFVLVQTNSSFISIIGSTRISALVLDSVLLSFTSLSYMTMVLSFYSLFTFTPFAERKLLVFISSL